MTEAAPPLPQASSGPGVQPSGETTFKLFYLCGSLCHRMSDAGVTIDHVHFLKALLLLQKQARHLCF
jgi:hypothetical protein